MLFRHLIPYIGILPLLHRTTASQAHLSMSSDQKEAVTEADKDDFSRPLNPLPTLFDTLLLQRSSSIFFDYLRELPSGPSRLLDPNIKSTLLVPSNKAVIALGWKPERGPPSQAGKESEVTISEEALESNVENWVGAHILPLGDLDFKSTKPQATLPQGRYIVIERRGDTSGDNDDWKNYGIVQGGNFIPLESRLQASNGVVYLINETIAFE